MKLHLSYRYTGENLEELSEIIKNIIDILEKNHEVFCCFDKNPYFKENNFTNKQILEYSLSGLEAADCAVALIRTPDKSEGMLLELGYALSKGKKIILLIHENVQTTFLEEIAHKTLRYTNSEDLYAKLKEFALE